MNKQHENILNQAKQLDQLPLDEITQAKLKAARLTALETLEQPSGSYKSYNYTKWMLPVAATSFAMLLGVMILPTSTVNNSSGELIYSESRANDSSELDSELYENLEFYQWLAANDKLG